MARIGGEMVEFRVDDSASRRFNLAMTLITAAGVVGIAYWCDRAYGRWSEEISLLAAPRTRLDQLRAGYQARRATATDAAQIISTVLDEIARATSTGSVR